MFVFEGGRNGCYSSADQSTFQPSSVAAELVVSHLKRSFSECNPNIIIIIIIIIHFKDMNKPGGHMSVKNTKSEEN